MEKINEYISYIPSVEEPLSADVYFIKGNKGYYIFDVGNNEGSLKEINSINGPKIVILSHYHKDHTGNIEKVNYEKLYVGDLTYDTIKQGVVVDEKITLVDGVKVEIVQCPSPHVDGSLIVNVNNEYTLIADLYFTRPAMMDKEKAHEMLKTLCSIDTKYFVVSHQEEQSIFLKEELLKELEEYFS